MVGEFTIEIHIAQKENNAFQNFMTIFFALFRETSLLILFTFDFLLHISTARFFILFAVQRTTTTSNYT